MDAERKWEILEEYMVESTEYDAEKFLNTKDGYFKGFFAGKVNVMVVMAVLNTQDIKSYEELLLLAANPDVVHEGLKRMIERIYEDLKGEETETGEGLS